MGIEILKCDYFFFPLSLLPLNQLLRMSFCLVSFNPSPHKKPKKPNTHTPQTKQTNKQSSPATAAELISSNHVWVFFHCKMDFLAGQLLSSTLKLFQVILVLGSVLLQPQSPHYIASHAFSPIAMNISICYHLFELLDLVFKPSPGCGIPARLKVFVAPEHEDFSTILRPDSVAEHSWWLEP